jgi:NAD-dependent deacetylase
MNHIHARAKDLLDRAGRILVLTGAGVSAESGVPTFRGSNGLWKTFRVEDLATPAAFARDPRLVWEWYEWRRRCVRECRPNAAHRALAALSLSPGSRVRLVTQNVDGLHGVAVRQLAAAADVAATALQSAVPLELHGSLFSVRCTICGIRRPHLDPVDASSRDTLPRCDRCDALLRPDIVWFGEPLDDMVLREALDRARTASVCLVVGTSGVVHPAASLAMVTKRSGGRLIEVNPEATPLTTFADVSIRATAGDAVPRIVGRRG